MDRTSRRPRTRDTRQQPVATIETDEDSFAADGAARPSRSKLGLAVATTVQVRAAGAELAQAIATYLHEYAGKSDSVVLRAGVVNNRPEFRVLRQAASQARYALIQLAKGVTTLRQSLTTQVERDRQQQRLRGYSERLNTAIELLGTVSDLPDSHLWVYRLAAEDDDPAAWTYERIPIHVFPEFQQSVVDRTHSTVLCSATLTVQHRFDYLASRLGITHRSGPAATARSGRSTLPSPFDYAKQSIVILTNHLPVPIPENEREFCEEMAADQAGFLSLSGGKTLTLFAARNRMEAIAAEVRTRTHRTCRTRRRAARPRRAGSIADPAPIPVRAGHRALRTAFVLGRFRRARRDAVVSLHREAALSASRTIRSSPRDSAPSRSAAVTRSWTTCCR